MLPSPEVLWSFFVTQPTAAPFGAVELLLG